MPGWPALSPDFGEGWGMLSTPFCREPRSAGKLALGRSSMGSMNPALTFLATTLQVLAFLGILAPHSSDIGDAQTAGKDLRNTSVQELSSENDAHSRGILGASSSRPV